LYNLAQRLFAEFVGTFVVVFVGAGVICTDEFLRQQNQHPLGILGIALAQGLVYAAMVTSLHHVSGGHLNPAVTVGFWVTRKLSTLDAIGYAIVQLAGASLAAYLLSGSLAEAVWRPVGLGSPMLATDFTRMHGMLLEGLLTFFLVFVFFATIADPNGATARNMGLAVGFAVAFGALLAGPFTGACMNPATAFGTALAAHHWTNQGTYWVGPLMGGILGAWVYSTAFLQRS
jgi:glycerol uptake facilitator protein